MKIIPNIIRYSIIEVNLSGYDSIYLYDLTKSKAEDKLNYLIGLGCNEIYDRFYIIKQ